MTNWSWDVPTGSGAILRMSVDVASQDAISNSTTVSASLSLHGYNSQTLQNNPKGTYISGLGDTVNSTFTWPQGTRDRTILAFSRAIYHNPDGTAFLSVLGHIDATGTTLLGGPTNNGAHAIQLPTIARATQPAVSPTSGNTGAAYAIGHVPASSAFHHDVAYSLDGGGSYADIALNVPGTTASTSWTPAHTLLPNSTGVTALIRVITRASSGGTIIGTKTVSLPLTVPASLKPTVSSVVFADAQTDSPNIPSLMGGAGRFVQRWSKLIPTVTAAGAGGSTVVSSSVTQAGQVTDSGTAFGQPVGLSGNVPYGVVATDSRGVVSEPYANTVPVTAYNFPNLPTPLVTRTEDAAGLIPSPTGTYLAITPGASVSSLFFGGAEKNLLEWQVRTRPKGGAWTTKQAWTAAGVSGNTWTTKFVAGGGYAASLEHEVEVSIRDVFGKNGFSTASTVTVVTVGVPSEQVFLDYDGNDGLGIGGYRRDPFILDAHGTIGQNGNAVLDEASGYARALLYTKAQLDGGQLDSRYYTETEADGLFARKVQGVIPSSVVVSSGSASVAADGTVTFSGLASISLNGIFDSLGLGAYKIFGWITGTTACNITTQMRANGVDTTTGYSYVGTSSSTATGPNRSTQSGAAAFGWWCPGASVAPSSAGELTLFIGKTGGASARMMSNTAATDRFMWDEYGEVSSPVADGVTIRTSAGLISGRLKVVKVA